MGAARHTAAVVAGAAAAVGADHALRQGARRLLHTGTGRTDKEVGVREATLARGGREKVANARLVSKRIEHGCGACGRRALPRHGHRALPPGEAMREGRPQGR